MDPHPDGSGSAAGPTGWPSGSPQDRARAALREPRRPGQARAPGPRGAARRRARAGARPRQRALRAQRHAAPQRRRRARWSSELDAMVGRLRAARRGRAHCSRCPTRCRSTRSPRRAAARARRSSTPRSASSSAAHGAYLVDLEAHPVASDRRLWNVDRLHANPEGHRRIALAAARGAGAAGRGPVVDGRVRRSARPPRRGCRTRSGRALPHAVADPAAARRSSGDGLIGQAPDARAGLALV